MTSLKAATKMFCKKVSLKLDKTFETELWRNIKQNCK